jgi:hypothetical protein
LRERTFLFEFGDQRSANDDLELLIANLIYVFLLFGSHGYVVSSNTVTQRLLGVQDGTIYFCSRHEDDLLAGEAVVKAYAQNPLASPKWVVDITVERQQQVT